MQHGGNVQIQIPQMGRAVKWLLIVSVVTFVIQAGIERWHSELPISYFLGFVPKLLLNGWIWQPFTYAFLHAGVFHLVFYLLVVWSIGSELDHTWGPRRFLVYFFGCTLGAALTYMAFAALGWGGAMDVPVVGSSGAVYGLLLAYGVLFGERTLYFFMIFPMKAKYFVMILGGVLLLSMLSNAEAGVAHAAHLGGLVAGIFLLAGMAAWKRRARGDDGRKAAAREAKERKERLEKASHLKLVKGDPAKDEGGGPKIWH
jgi:membrane associated rhomboid family serine protease